ncbi:MAG: hypothetical protein K2H73_08655 [Treponemataceae bacterium]|nr:hypothetical protein [Treponemataceae bacterium]
MDEYKKRLVESSNKDDTNALEMEKKSLEHIGDTADPKGKDLTRNEENRFAKKVEEITEHQKKYR